MTITKKVVYIECIFLAFIAAISGMVDIMGIFIVLNSALALFIVADFYMCDDSSAIKISRCGEDKLSIYENEKITFKVENMRKEPIFIEMIGEKVEPYFRCDENSMEVTLKSRESKELSYEMIPLKRGAYQFGEMFYRITGKMGLVKRQYSEDLSQEFKVYPNMKNIKRYKLMMMSSKNLKDGRKKVRQLGEGREFESLREYVSGDQYKKINWKASAREGIPIVNQFDVEKNQNVYTMIDCGHPMSYTIKGYNKLELALNSALLLMDIANGKGDKSGVVTFNKNVESFIKAGKGMVHRKRLMDTLYHIQPSREASNYEDAFLFFKGKEKKRSLICIYTDFNTLQEGEHMMRKISVLSKQNIVLIITMKDPKLHQFKEMKTRGAKDMFDKGTALEFLKDREKMIKKLNTRGVMCIECDAENLNTDVINKYISIKNRGII